MNKAIRQLFERGLGDARVRSLAWIDNDLCVELAVPNVEEKNLQLIFSRVSHCRMDIDFGEYVGQPLVFSADAHEIESGAWKIRFDFGVAPDGFIEFLCERVFQGPST